ncbi:MAG: response regulator transcription factor [Clostridiales bacterium]|jgi:DNA-binding response OmpR family regulator|nr:response regulator transcription factor [Clostridiales bacterium]
MSNILLIDDNAEIQTANRDYLTKQGFCVTCADTGIKALAYINENRYDCIVLDILLPDLDGYSICKAARTVTNTPILFLSCLEETDDKIKGLASGGDDYMTKPYSLKELTARINAMLRRGNSHDIPRGDFYIDHDNKIIHSMGKNVLLSEREFNLFILFYENPGRVFSKKEILNKIWYGNAEIGVVAVMVLKLRRKIEFAESVIGSIENTYGTGYRLTLPEKEGAMWEKYLR